MSDPATHLRVDDAVSIPRSEIRFKASRSGGPGGQHVNTSSTRVELSWNVHDSTALDDERRARLVERLAARLDKDGNLRIVSSAHRSQSRNREDAERRLAEAVARALRVQKKRRRTRPSRAAVEARLDAKRKRSERKQQRRDDTFD